MGVCGQGGLNPEQRKKWEQERQANAMIDMEGKKAKTDSTKLKKLLLLGAGESGKSTIFKQMITLYGVGYSEKDRIGYKDAVHTNILKNIQALLEAHEQFLEQKKIPELKEENISRKQMVIDLNCLQDFVTFTISKHIKALWEDPAIQETYKRRSEYQLNDNTYYFFDKMHEVQKKEYIPTFDDILQVRLRTTGIVEQLFDIEGQKFKFMDVGGQRNERNKWIHCFEDVTAVIFVAAINEYDQMLFEDNDDNRIQESLALFDEICNSRWFKQTSMILFLNKKDLFLEKIKTVPITEQFSDYVGDPHDPEHVLAYLQEKFETLNKQPTKQIYTHVTCALDTGNMKHVIISVKDKVVADSLSKAGVLLSSDLQL